MAEATTKQDESFMRVISYCTCMALLFNILCLILQHSSVAQQEQQEKAWLRHKHALAKVKLERVSLY